MLAGFSNTHGDCTIPDPAVSSQSAVLAEADWGSVNVPKLSAVATVAKDLIMI